MKPLLLIYLAISSYFVALTNAAAVTDPSGLPADAELKRWIVGSWRVDYPSKINKLALHYGYEIYHEDGTYKHFAELKEGSAPARLVFDVSGTWDVEGGYLLKKVTAANTSPSVGHTFKEKIESANPDWFIVQQASGLCPRRRTHLPAELASPPPQVPRIFTVEEAAQVLRYAVKPEYSNEARRTRARGSGIFELRFDYETGRLKAIDIVQSTGSRILDHDAINAFKDWRAKPRTVHVMRIPITFGFYG